MKKARLWELLWILFLSELQAAFELQEEKYAKTEGQNLTVRCPFNIMMYFYSQKAWQRLQDTGEPLTLAITEKSSGNPSQVQVGKYTLKDDPSEAMLYVQMTNLQVEDSGLYRCVIYHPPADPIILFRPVRLVVTKDSSVTPASDKNPTLNSAKIPTLTTTKDPSNTHARYRTVTQPLPKTTALISSLDPGVNFTNKTDVIRVPVLSFVVPVTCGLLSKSLVFGVLFAVTQRSFGS
ncbi:triggering receptor expressed on myeloid cells 1 isoform X2 [Castor canadensis]|uniref:Triggering receptor expressed on myeloid cells 1 n=1 Tax=Castor canadensis TaxID=51338 RepID=A0A250YD61_CASCN|nr:triggering receptor expressed on myeloid cells 1 isoform X1 [Castor canadensis]